MDDYAPLRETTDLNTSEAKLFSIKDALAYVQSGGKYGQGSTYYLAENPDFGAVFTYYLKEKPKSSEKVRKEKEEELFKEGKPIPQLSWKASREEEKEETSYLLFTIKDETGQVVRKITKSPSKGINRINWDLRYASSNALRGKVEKFDPVKDARSGFFVMPGKYTVTLGLYDKGNYKELVTDKQFTVKQLNNTTLPATDKKAMADFQRKVTDKVKIINATINYVNELNSKVLNIKQTIINVPDAKPELMKEIQRIEMELDKIIFAIEGLEAKASFEEIPPHEMAISKRVQYIMRTHYNSTSAITQTEKEQLAIVEEQMPPLIEKLRKIALDDMVKLEKQLDELKAPWTPGRLPEWK